MTDQFQPIAWSINTNIYEINLRQYSEAGSFAAFARQLPRLKDMGVTVLWFMPVTPISLEKRQGSLGSYYACSDYTSTNPEFGSLADFGRLVTTAHSLGMKVIIDWVANHTGWDHHWTVLHPDYYLKNADGEFFDANGWIDVIDLDYNNPALEQAMLDAMKFWVTNYDIDGFRCDMAMLVPLTFWKMVRTELDMIKPLFWLAECEEVDYHEAFDASYGWKLLHTLESFWKGQTDLNGVGDVLAWYQAGFPAGAMHLLFTSNHDENSHSGSEYERLGFSSRAFAVLTCMWNGIPLIYTGQELPNKKRLKFFDKDPIEWTGENVLHQFYKSLLSLRRSNAVFADIQQTAAKRLPTSHGAVFAFTRTSGEDQVLVVLNLSYDDVQAIRLFESPMEGNFRNIFSSHELYIKGETTFGLKPWEYVVYERLKS